MFCCTRKPDHYGEIVTSICVQADCIEADNQLSCIKCIQEHHSLNHQIVSMKDMLPELLQANNAKQHYLQLLKDLLIFVSDECAEEQCLLSLGGVGEISILNVVEATKAIITEMKKKSQSENKKIRQIEKTLQIQSMGKGPVKSQILNSSPPKNTQNYYSTIKTQNQFQPKASQYNSVPISASQIANLDTFSMTLKHPYASVSSDLRTISKNSPANGYKLAILSGAPFPSPENQPIIVKMKIEKSGGNLMIGLGHAEIIRDKQYTNCYGIGQGAYVLSQNGDDPKSATIFHHSNSIYNRKDIVAWNYSEGETIGVGVMKDSGVTFVVFKKYYTKENGKVDMNKVVKQFSMPLFNPQKSQVGRFYLLVMLQGVGDTVSLVEEQQ